nr:tetratricopeptide repeat protein [Phenylobacterium aquaticum]
MTFAGHGPDELRQGVEYLKRAVEFEPANADAQFLVGRAFQGGWGGTETNPKAAFAHFEAAAKLGDGRALRYIGMARLQGAGVEQNPAAALVDFKAAAERGNVWAMIDIAVMLATGEGVPADPPQARDWYAKAASRGSAHGLRGLGVMLYRGEGGAKDLVLGRAYLELAVAGGDDLAQQVAHELFGELSQADRAAVDQAKADWLKTHPTPRAD